MRQILFKSILAVTLGTAPVLAHAQGEMLRKKPAEQSQGQGGGQSGTEGRGTEGGQRMEENGGENGQRPATEGQQNGQNPQSEENRNEEGGEQKRPMGQEHMRPGEHKQGEEQKRENKGEEHKQGEEQKRPGENQGEEHKQGEEQRQPGENQGEEHGGGTSKRHAERGHVSDEQRTEIKRVFVEHHVEPAHVNFSVDVGARVPREIHLYRLPPRIVEIVPGYEGYMYFELADGRIAIVDPQTLEIVLIIA